MRRPSSRLILATIVLLAAALRFYQIDLTWFFLDHARDVSTAADIASGTSFPLLGPRIGSTNAYLGPFYYYILAIPFSIADDPVAAVVFVALGQLFALIALHRFASEFFDTRVATYATLLYAFFPLTIFSSRLVWTVGLLPLGVILFMHALSRLIVAERSAAIIPLLALLAVLTQLHLTSIAFAGVGLAALLLARPRIRPIHAAAGAALFVLLYLPYLLHEVGHGFENSLALLRSAASDQGLTRFAVLPSVAGKLALLFLPALRGFVVDGRFSNAFLAAFDVLYVAEAAAFWSGLVLCVFCAVTRKGRIVQRRPALLLLLWVLVPLLTVQSKNTPLWWYYLDIVHPAPFLLAAIALAWLPSVFRDGTARRRATQGVAGLTAAIVVVQAWFVLGFQRQAEERGELIVQVPKLCINDVASPFETLVTLPLGYRRNIVQTLVRDFGIGEQDFFEKVHGAVLGLAEESRYLVSHLSPPRPVPAAGGVDYLVTRAADEIDANVATRIGPYALIARPSMIDADSWSCAVVPRGAAPSTEWTRVRLPGLAVGLAVGENEELVCRGTVRVPRSQANALVSVSMVGWAPFEAVAIRVGDRRLAPQARVRGQDPLMLKENGNSWGMGIGWVSETVFDLAGSIPSGAETVTIEIAGSGKLIALDVYEGRSW